MNLKVKKWSLKITSFKYINFSTWSIWFKKYFRTSSSEDPWSIVLRQLITDSAPGNAASFGEAACWDPGVRTEIWRVQDENTGNSKRLQLLSPNPDEGIARTPRQRFGSRPRRRQRVGQSYVAVLRPRNSDAASFERCHYQFSRRRKLINWVFFAIE